MNLLLRFLTTFPEIIDSYFSYSLPGKAVRNRVLSYQTIQIRDFTSDKHKTTDDTPFGGGNGMLMKPEPVYSALQEPLKAQSTIVLLTPKGEVFNQNLATELSRSKDITFVCGHYEGIDNRIDLYSHYQISIGDYVIGGGEIASLVITDAIIRLLPGVMGNNDSLLEESFEDDWLEYPQYTKPADFLDIPVPEVLKNGHHAQINAWRKKQSLKWTLLLRSDLMLKHKTLTKEEKKLLKEIRQELIDSINQWIDYDPKP
ncbi:tRNA (guanosine(37)-N1)-methyltransferase TrmD [bacterium]|nr:tRNA (guanosine(37)-N1)-methyltransferase TrmD [bacterium]